MLLFKLERFGIVPREIWSYFEVKDIVYLSETNTDIREFCLRINRIIDMHISLRRRGSLARRGYKSESDRNFMLINILKIFPNISKLVLYDDEVQFDKSLSVIYNSNSICDSLKEFKVIVSQEGGLSGISNLRNLHTLNLELSVSLLFEELSYISLLTNLHTLNLSYSDVLVNINGNNYLSSLVNLTHLDMTHGSFDANAFSFMSSTTKIRHLSLGKNILFSNHVKAMSSLVNLTYLDLSELETPVSQQGGLDLSKLSSLTNLKTLNLCQHCIYDNKFSFIQNIKSLTSFDISNSHFTTDLLLFYLTGLVNLTWLNLSDCISITDQGLFHISTLTNLTNLNLSNQMSLSKITDNGLIYISKLKNMKILNLSYNFKITHRGLMCLSSWKHLIEISLYDWEDNSIEEWENFKFNTNI